MLVYGSQVVKFWGTRSTSVPPYVGVPSVFHQLPVLVVVAVTLAPEVVVVEVVPVGIITALVVVVWVDVVVVVAVVVDVEVELPHDDNTKDVTKRKASDTRIIPLFM